MQGTAAQASRLGKLEAPSRSTTRPGGLLIVPPIQQLDQWERLAVVSQQRLASQTREGIAEPEAPQAPALDACTEAPEAVADTPTDALSAYHAQQRAQRAGVTR